MAIAFVTGTSGASNLLSTGTTISFSASAGAAVVIGIFIPSGTVTVSSVTDSAGNTYTKQKQIFFNTTSNDVEIWTANSITAITSVTIKPTTTTANCKYAFGEYTGITSFQNASSNTGSSTAPSLTVSPFSGGSDWSIAVHAVQSGLGSSNTWNGTTTGNQREAANPSSTLGGIALCDNTSATTTESLARSAAWGVVGIEAVTPASTGPGPMCLLGVG